MHFVNYDYRDFGDVKIKQMHIPQKNIFVFVHGAQSHLNQISIQEIT